MKVNIGSVRHNSKKFPTQSVDINTTTDFGFMQPMCGTVELIPNSTLTVNHKGFVRMHTMVAPTFGRVSARMYHYFVPIADIWHPFENLISSQPYNGVGTSYIPTEVPNVTPKTFMAVLMMHSYCTVYNCNLESDGSISNLSEITGSTRVNAINDRIDTVLTKQNIDLSVFTSSYPWVTYKRVNLNDEVPVKSNPSNADIVFVTPVGSGAQCFCFKLNNAGRNIRKVLIGLGYKISFQQSPKSILPIFAYLKCYFDYWYPQRHITWKNTDAYKFLETIEQYNATTLFDFAEHGVHTSFYKALFSLHDCYYYQDPDYFSSQFSSLVNNTVADQFGVPDSTGPRTDVVQLSSTSLPQISGGTLSSSLITSPRIKALNFLTKYVNKHSVIGGKIDAWLKSQFGADYIQADNSYFIGEDSFTVDLSEVMSTSGTTEVNLGEYGGRGTGYSDGRKLKIHSNTFGYYINMFTVIPLTRYNQGSNPNLNHLSKFDFYHSGLDGLTLLPTPKDSLFAEQFYNRSIGNLSESFGFQTIYQEYKNFGAQNILNGDMSLPSTRDSYKPYYLDRELTNQSFSEVNEGGTTKYKYDGGIQASDLVASINWRSIGLYRFLGNYNRIFLSAQPTTEYEEYDLIDEPIISQNIIEYDLVAPMLAYKDSLDTDGFENGLSIEHS